MGECGIRGGYAEIVNMDPEVMAMLQKSISAKLCPPVLGQVRTDISAHPSSDRSDHTALPTRPGTG